MLKLTQDEIDSGSESEDSNSEDDDEDNEYKENKLKARPSGAFTLGPTTHAVLALLRSTRSLCYIIK